MNRYKILFHETRRGKVEVKAENKDAAVEMLMQKSKSCTQISYSPPILDYEVISEEPLRPVEFERCEILGIPALYSGMSRSETLDLQIPDNIYQYEVEQQNSKKYPIVITRRAPNRLGIILTTRPLLDAAEEKRIISVDDCVISEESEPCTLEDYIAENDKEEKQPEQRTFEILQLRPENRRSSFLSYYMLQEMRVVPKASYYVSVYKGVMDEDMDLNRIYVLFNGTLPPDYRGHPLSVSDVVVLHDSTGKRAIYVDSFGFQPLPGFFDEPNRTKDMIQRKPHPRAESKRR